MASAAAIRSRAVTAIGAAARRRRSLAAVIAALVPTPLAIAHHSVLPYDNARGLELAGTVAGTVWQNPHTYIYVEVAGDSGEVQRWTVESEGASVLRRLGWSAESLPRGARIEVVGAPARDGSRALRCTYVVLASERLPCFATSSDGRDRAPNVAPRETRATGAPP